MNVIIMGNFLYPKGMAATKRVQYFIDYLRDRGVSVKLLLLRQAQTKIPKQEREGSFKGIFYKTIGNDLKCSPSILFKLPLHFWLGSITLIKWKRKNAKNILYCYAGPSIENLWFILFAKILRFRIVFDIVEDFSDFDGPLHLRVKFLTISYLEGKITKLSNGLVVISRYLMDKYEKRAGKTVPIKLIPVSARINKDKEKMHFGDTVKIIYSGSFGKKDGVELLISAFENVYQSYKNVELLLTGKGAETNIARIIAKITNKNNIKYLGYLNDDAFYDLLQEADILCMIRTNSKFANGGFPFKLGEYLATANPVIATNVCNVSNYLENMKDALLVEPENVKELQQAIEYLLRNPDIAINIGLSGREKCRKFFDPKRNGSLLLDLLELL
jgi:glycosyltransferase involved in cell wall biosynthesis